MLKPREHDQLVLHLKDVNLARPDHYGTAQLVAFLEQMVDHRGFYDRNLEWVGLDNVQLVVSISNASGAERFALPERCGTKKNTWQISSLRRFVSKLRVLRVDAPAVLELRTICAAYLAPVLGKSKSNQSKLDSLAGSMANMFVELTKAFGPGEQFHYRFTPSDLTKWTCALMRHEIGGQ